jgi:hypothetical protein
MTDSHVNEGVEENDGVIDLVGENVAEDVYVEETEGVTAGVPVILAVFVDVAAVTAPTSPVKTTSKRICITRKTSKFKLDVK